MSANRSATYRSESSLQEVTHRRSRTLRLCVAVLHTCELKKTLGGGRSDETSTSWRWDETAHDGADLSGDLRGDGVRVTERSTPVTSSNRDDREFGEDDGATDGGGDFLGALNTESDVPVKITDGNERLEACPLTGARLLLHGHDLHDLILELREEEVDNLVLLDGEREEIDLLHRLDLAVLYKTTELGDGNPA